MSYFPAKILRPLLVMVAVGATASPALGENVPTPAVRAEAFWSNPTAHGGDRRVLAVVVEIQQDLHINPAPALLHDDLLIPTELRVINSPPQLAIGTVHYPQPQAIEIGPIRNPRQIEGYKDRVVFYLPITIDSSAPPETATLGLELIYQACNRTQCFTPVTEKLEVSLSIVDQAVPVGKTQHGDLFTGFNPATEAGGGGVEPVDFDVLGLSFSINSTNPIGLLLLLAVAAVGGLLLNFTPCVLPIIPLKMMSLSLAAGSRARCFSLGLMMSAGVVTFWLGLGITIATVSGFTATNQLFQYPSFTLAVGLFIAIMAVGMLGFYTTKLPRFAYAFDPKQDTLPGSFALGVITAILSTPCTAPLMGAAAAWATTQPPAITLATFTAIGSGMALPYLILSAYPQLIQRMPRTGPASELVKQVMGLLLLAASAYFVGVGLTGWFIEPTGPPALSYWWAVMACVALAGGWLAYRVRRVVVSPARRVVLYALGGVLIVGSIYGGVRLTDKGPIDWVYYTPDRFAQALHENRVVVMDFTAEWCLNCKWLEKNVLNQPAIVKRLSQSGVVAIKVDLTGRNQAGSRMLEQVHRVAIPLLVIFGADGREVFKGDFYSAQQVIEAIDQAMVINPAPVNRAAD